MTLHLLYALVLISSLLAQEEGQSQEPGAVTSLSNTGEVNKKSHELNYK